MGQKQKRLYSLLGVSTLLALMFAVYYLQKKDDVGPHYLLDKKIESFSLLDSNGQETSVFEAMDATNSEYVLVSMWATWCGPCVKELPWLESMKDEFAAKKISLLLINYDVGSSEPKNRDIVKKWLAKKKITLMTSFDSKEDFLEYMQVYALPFNALIRKDRTLLYADKGELEKEKIFEIVDADSR